MALYDAKGNLVEDVVSKADVEKIQSEHAQFKADLESKEAELTKLREKDINFRRLNNLHNKSEEEKKKILEKMTEGERLNHERLELLETSFTEKEKEYRQMLSNHLSGGNEEMGKLINDEVERLEIAYGVPKNATERTRLFSDAKAIVENRERQKINPFNAINVPTTDATSLYPERKKQNYADTVEGKDLAGRLGLMTEEPQKK